MGTSWMRPRTSWNDRGPRGTSDSTRVAVPAATCSSRGGTPSGWEDTRRVRWRKTLAACPSRAEAGTESSRASRKSQGPGRTRGLRESADAMETDAPGQAQSDSARHVARGDLGNGTPPRVQPRSPWFKARGPSITGTPHERRPGCWKGPGRPDIQHHSRTRRRCTAPRGTPRMLSHCTGCHSCSPRSTRHSHNGRVNHQARSYTRDPRCIRRARRVPLRRHGVAGSSHSSCTRPCTLPRYNVPPRRDSPRGPGTPRTGSPHNTVTRVRNIPRLQRSPVPCPRRAHPHMRDCTDRACDRHHSRSGLPYRQLRKHRSPRQERNRHNIRHRSHTGPGNTPCPSRSGEGCLEHMSR